MIVCAWCPKDPVKKPNEYDPKNSPAVSHGMCKECEKKFIEQMNAGDQKSTSSSGSSK